MSPAREPHDTSSDAGGTNAGPPPGRGASQAPEGPQWLAEVLWSLGSIQFGDFSLGRTVRNSPVYLNPKLLISSPADLRRAAAVIEEDLRLGMAMRNQQVEPFQVIAGVPVGGLHLATALSLQMTVPQVYARPGSPWLDDDSDRPHIEGVYRPGQTTLIVDDLAAGGGSLVETVGVLRRAGLHVRDAIVLIDREQGAGRRLEDTGVRLHSILTLEALLAHLHSRHHVEAENYVRAMQYLHREGDIRSEFD